MSVIDSERSYLEYHTSAGYDLEIYAVPETIVASAHPPGKTKPKVPLHEMKTVAGVQRRPAKEGDPEWEPYLHALSEYEDEEARIQENLALVLALKTFPWPESPIEPPEELQIPVQVGIVDWPPSDDIISQRAAHLRAVVAPAARDISEINYRLMILSGTPKEVVDQMREGFQRKLRESLLGSTQSDTDS